MPKVIPAGTLGSAIEAAIAASGAAVDPEGLTVNVTQTLADGSKESRPGLLLSEIDSIVDLGERGLAVSVSAGPSGPDWHYLGVHGGDVGRAALHVQTPTAGIGQAMIDAFMMAAGLEPYVLPVPEPEPEQFPSYPALAPDAAADTIQAQQSAPGRRRLRAFMSYRFGQPGNETSANLVQRFLELEDVEVLTGRSYEPRPLHEKVSDRLSGIDFLVLLIGTDGESMWTRDEIATARAARVAVVPIVAEGSTLEPGLFGDLEYITVAPDHVADAFIPLLEAIIYLRRRSG